MYVYTCKDMYICMYMCSSRSKEVSSFDKDNEKKEKKKKNIKAETFLCIVRKEQKRFFCRSREVCDEKVESSREGGSDSR
jgi:hypothetical protein